MTTITFDTHKFIRTLKEAGVPESQAEAFSDAFKEAQGEAELATQHDITDVRRDISDLRRDMDTRLIQLEQRLIIKLGTLIAFAIGVVAVLVKLL
ncbi:MAG: DUF1640 domain-containing protein [Methylobacter sp.]|jgi:hypothetical protein|nr:DUF1640 domain-containing protein [Methylobacter sp.]